MSEMVIGRDYLFQLFYFYLEQNNFVNVYKSNRF